MKPRELIRVLVIDDSAFSRRTITRMLETSPLVEVIGVARDGEEALRKAIELKPDLVTLDLEMPRMDGFTFLRLVMAKCPTPVMVISGKSGEGDVFKALDLGAVDFIAKPTPHAAPELQNIQSELIRKVHAIRELRIEKVKDRIVARPPVVGRAVPEPPARSKQPERPAASVCVIGSSTGGPSALMQTLAAFHEPPPCAFLIAQHMPAGFTLGFAERLNRMTPFEVKQAEGGEMPTPGRVLLAPGGCHLELENANGRVLTRVVESRPGDKYTPSVDRLFESAAKHYGRDLLAVVLTGMGDDGRRGVLAVNECGGRVIAESEETAVIFGMPQQAIRAGVVDEVLPLHEVPRAIQSGMAGKRSRKATRRGSA